MSTEKEGIVAVLPQRDSRAVWWNELFGQPRVPVTQDDPLLTILPSGNERLCYFVDFSSCDWLHPRLTEILTERKAHPATLGALKAGIYPVIADGVTVIRAPRRFFGIWANDE